MNKSNRTVITECLKPLLDAPSPAFLCWEHKGKTPITIAREEGLRGVLALLTRRPRS